MSSTDSAPAASGPRVAVHVVPHTHWDREWYHEAGRFRQRLVALVDELLDDPLRDEGAGFLLDGQAVVVDDYLDVRPDRAALLGERLREGALEAGPWYVLADELIPGAEALVRNLLAGRRTLARLGAASPPVLYCPDSFGHPAALPTLAAGFGLPLVVVWRGYGGARWPAGDAAWWRAADGSRALLYHLPHAGYEFGSSLPPSAAAAGSRWEELRAELVPRARLGAVLVQNGADHHARQRRLPEAFAALAAAAAPHETRWSTLGGFAPAALAAAPAAALPEVRGELRDSYGYTWTLQGTFAARAQQKRRNAHAERLLTREAEPWAVLAARAGGADRRALTHAAWRTLLLCHPHDTLCGCSVDAVARAMDARLDGVLAEGAGLRDDSLLDVIGHDAVDARERRAEWVPVCVVRNAAARPRGGVAELEVESFVRDVPVGPGSGVARRPADALAGIPVVLDAGRVAVQVLDRRLEQRRTESPRHYPDNDLVEVARAVAWVEPVAGYGTHSYALGGARSDTAAAPVAPVTAADGALDNGVLRLTIDRRGDAQLAAADGRASAAPLVTFEDVGDAGDLYTHSPAGATVSGAWPGDARVVHRGPLRGAIECRLRLRVPAALRPDPPGEPLSVRPARAGRPVELPLTVTYTLDAASDLLRVRVEGVNVARDHRLRVVFHTGVVEPLVVADAAFGPVARRPLVVPPEDAAAELPPPTAPLHRYVSLYGATAGATLVSDGLAEYEARADGTIAVTLVRAVGELSRNDLPERAGHAGWPVPTPAAQCRGPFEAEFALLLHGPRDAATADRIERATDDALVPLRGATLRSALAVPAPTAGAELEGAGLAFGALKAGEDARWTVARAVNTTDGTVAGRWRFAGPVAEARLARLDETPGDVLAVAADGSVAFEAAPHAVVTILVR